MPKKQAAKERRPKLAKPQKAQKPAATRRKAPTPSRYASLTVYDPATRTVVGGAGAPAALAPAPAPASDPRQIALPGVLAGVRAPGHVPVWIPVGGELAARHAAARCPWCADPERVMRDGWPARCTCTVSFGQQGEHLVLCVDTAQAGMYGHHWNCPYWDHDKDGVPF